MKRIRKVDLFIIGLLAFIQGDIMYLRELPELEVAYDICAFTVYGLLLLGKGK